MPFPVRPPRWKAPRPLVNVLRVHEVIDVLRCPLAAVSAFLCASALGLGYPSWAAVSAIIVLQEDLIGTRTAVHWRLIGTMTGVAVALICGTLLMPFSTLPALQIGISVAVCSAIARVNSSLRVAMWTAPIVFMSRAADVTLFDAGLARGCEVVIGCVTATLVQWLVESALGAPRAGGLQHRAGPQR